MKPIVILSTTIDPDYLFCLPITAKTWDLQGFYCYIAICADNYPEICFKYIDKDNYFSQHILDKYDCPLNPSLISQCVRLYLPGEFDQPERYVILSDVDMLIGSNFLYRDFHKINVFGHDLTGYDHIPICYTGMTVENWRRVMAAIAETFPGFSYDLDQFCNLQDKHRAWVADQDILTAKLKEYGYEKINFIPRGTDHYNSNLPLGRWDRYNNMKRPNGPVHDVHLMRKPYEQNNTDKIIEICKDLYPKEDWTWIQEYRDEFVKEMNL